MILNTSKKYNLPVNIILGFGHLESHMGTKGRAVETKNPMNVGNTTAGDYKGVKCGVYNNCLSSWQEGLNQFARLITECYFNENEPREYKTLIDRNFIAQRCNIKGLRYMTDTRSVSKHREKYLKLEAYGL